MSEFLENEFVQLRSCDAATDPLAGKYGEIGLAAVAAALRVMGRPTGGKRRTECGEQRSETAVFLRDDTVD